MKRFLLLIMSVSLITAAMAQVTTSSISGTVKDEKGQALIGATVKAVHTPTGTVYAISTAKNGQFNIGGMRVGGPYTVEASYIGYNTEKITGMMLTLGEEATVNFILKESSQQLEDIVVMGKTNPVFSSNRTGAQEVITSSMMAKLPSMNRSLNDFTKLSPMASGNSFGGTSYRFNNVTVDGASFNNSFGLGSSLGASGTEPISLEALDQVQVMIAPYDVRNGAFTGAAINSVTKSGTNDWQASAYFYKKSPSMTGWRQKDDKANISEFISNQYGVSVGGPIIKNKLFFFVNGELDRQETPINFRPSTNGVATGNFSKASVGELQEIKDFLIDKFDYNPGSFQVPNTPTKADRITARVDWNINDKNTLSVKYFYLKSFNTNMPSSSGAPANGRGANAWAIPFSSSYYRTNNNFNIIMADLNTTINDRMSNTLKIGYSRLRDFREMDGGFFPQVDILKDASGFTTFGTEANSYNNQLDSDIFQIQDNFTWNLGRHQLTFGTQSDFRKFKNGFANSFAGQFRYASFADFKKEVEEGVITQIDKTFSQAFSKKGAEFPFAKIDVLSLGFYVQDKWTVLPNLNVTLGLRVDTPIFLNDLERNEVAEGFTFQGGTKIDVSKLPAVKPLFSPRIGFNWDVMSDRTLQVRGGTGIFSGTPPYVWLSNQAGNNGMLFGKLNQRPFDGIANYQPTAAEIGNSKMDMAVTDPNFKYPQLWKTNIAVDYSFLGGWIFTAEMLYNKDVNAIYHTNIGLKDVQGYVSEGDLNGRPIFASAIRENKDEGGKGQVVLSKTHTNFFITDETENVVLMKNTNKGFSIYTTLQLQKNFTRGALNGLYVNGSYSFGKSKGVTDGSSSVASSAWKYRPAINPNAEELAYASASFNDRFLLQVAYTANWSKNASTSFGLIYQRYRPFRYSYTYNGDMNGDGQNMNDLIYIPKNKTDVNIVQDRLTDKNGKFMPTGDTRTADQIWAQIDAFIEQDPYLRKNRGKYAERNGAVTPYANQIDVNLSHDIRIPLKNGKMNTLRFSFDIANLANLLNKNWGVQSTTVLGHGGSPQYQFLKLIDAPSAANQYKPSVTMPLNSGKPITETFKDLNGSASRWAIQFGVKYMFN